MNVRSTLLSLSLFGLCSMAAAQWQWLDAQGRKVFSDRAPGPEVQDTRILARPRPALRAPAAGDAPSAAVPVAAQVSAPMALPLVLPSGVDKALEASRRQAAEAEASQRQSGQERLARVRADNCARAKQALADLDAGLRVARRNASGEREVLDDAARAAERTRTQGVVQAECG